MVREFEREEDLQKPEKTILDLVRTDLWNMRMLDIGVGAGRTALHFADRVKEYVGIDYSTPMIDACRKKFAGRGEGRMTFKVADAADLGEFPDGTFDFILFSFNGLDYLDHDDRIRILREIKRTGKRGSLFAFSAHNLHSLERLLSFPPNPNPLKTLRRFLRSLRLLVLNGPPRRLLKKDWVVVNDGAYGFKFRCAYISPPAQVEQLTRLGFEDIRLFSLEHGGEIAPSDYAAVKDSWIYYLCRNGTSSRSSTLRI